jgi:hypothetical protein
MHPIKPKNQRFRGITLSPELQGILKESAEEDARQPEDQNSPDIPNMQKRFGGLGGD